MGCGCGGGKTNKVAAKARNFNSVPVKTVSAIIPSVPPANSGMVSNNIKPMGMIDLPPGSIIADGRRIKELRKQAIMRSLSR